MRRLKRYSKYHDDYRIAAVCELGHVQSSDAPPRLSRFECARCQEPVLNKCPKCDAFIRGDFIAAGGGTVEPYRRPWRCHVCWTVYPWGGLEARTHEALKLLNEARLDPRTEASVKKELEALLELPDADEHAEISGWRKIKTAAPGFVATLASNPLFNTIVLLLGTQTLPPPGGGF